MNTTRIIVNLLKLTLAGHAAGERLVEMIILHALASLVDTLGIDERFRALGGFYARVEHPLRYRQAPLTIGIQYGSFGARANRLFVALSVLHVIALFIVCTQIAETYKSEKKTTSLYTVFRNNNLFLTN